MQQQTRNNRSGSAPILCLIGLIISGQAAANIVAHTDHQQMVYDPEASYYLEYATTTSPMMLANLSQPLYPVANQYIDYYWPPPPPPLQRIEGPPSALVPSRPDDQVLVELSPGLLRGLTSMRETVLVVIERIRFVWEYVWRYFREADSPTSARSSGSKAVGRRNHHNQVGKKRVRLRYRKFLIPLLLAYKLKFFTMIPMLISGLVLLTGSAGMTGFFFALFTAVLSMKHKPA